MNENEREKERELERKRNSITRSYRRERGRERERKRERGRERKGVGTIGLDWLGIGWGEGWRGGRGMAAGLVPLAWPSRPLSPHSTPS